MTGAGEGRDGPVAIVEVEDGDSSTLRLSAVDTVTAGRLEERRLRSTLPPQPGVEVIRPRYDTPKTVVVSGFPSADRGTLTVLAGPDAGATHALEEDTFVVGRDPSAHLVVDDPSVSRFHARISRDAQGNHVIEDLGSTNGTFVSGSRVDRAVLVQGDRVQLGRDTVYRFAVLGRDDAELHRRLYEASMRDTLTGLPNRRFLFDRLKGEIAYARRSAGELGLLMLDVDYFKTINDDLGHLAGDEVLRGVARAARGVVRAGDLLARYGGEEFVVLARGAAKPEAMTLAERLRQAVMALEVELTATAVRVTVCVGVAALSECASSAAAIGDDAARLLQLADERLYVAKGAGRNRSCGG